MPLLGGLRERVNISLPSTSSSGNRVTALHREVVDVLPTGNVRVSGVWIVKSVFNAVNIKWKQ